MTGTLTETDYTAMLVATGRGPAAGPHLVAGDELVEVVAALVVAHVDHDALVLGDDELGLRAGAPLGIADDEHDAVFQQIAELIERGPFATALEAGVERQQFVFANRRLQQQVPQILGEDFNRMALGGIGHLREHKRAVAVVAAQADSEHGVQRAPHQQMLGVLVVSDQRVAQQGGGDDGGDEMPKMRRVEGSAEEADSQGHEVVVANNGKQALAAWETQSFDVILMDVQMPELDGLESLKRRSY